MGKTAFLFSGQGAQTVGMGKDLYFYSETAKNLYDFANEKCKNLINTCFYGEQTELNQTKNAQPCLYATAYAFANELKNKGVSCDYVAGFSLGEITAMAFCDVFSFADGLELIALRGREMQNFGKTYDGGMVAVINLSRETTQTICEKVGDFYAVNYNCTGQIACAGKREKVDDFIKTVKENGGRAVALPVSGAFHLDYLSPVGERIEEFLLGKSITPPTHPIYSNFSGKLYKSDTQSIIYGLKKQVSSAVKFEDILLDMEKNGVDDFIEIGAGKTLSGFVKKTVKNVKVSAVYDVATLENALKERLI